MMLLGGSALADELSNDPQAKIGPPGGVQASQQEPLPDDPQAKIGPPVGIQTSQQEPNIPMLPDGVATQTLFDAFRIWLSLQHILLPIG